MKHAVADAHVAHEAVSVILDRLEGLDAAEVLGEMHRPSSDMGADIDCDSEAATVTKRSL
jgi:hypothetical protein